MIKQYVLDKFYSCDELCWEEVFWFAMVIISGSSTVPLWNNLKAFPKCVRECINNKRRPSHLTGYKGE